jgi:Putative transposase
MSCSAFGAVDLHALSETFRELIERVQQTVRRRLLRAFVGRGYLDSSDAKAMQAYDHGGGFSVDASVRIGQHDRAGLAVGAR